MITQGDCCENSQEQKVTNLYIGCKIIKAKPMTSDEFANFKGKEIDKNSENAHGYLVEYEDGYTSWSPKSTFERAYRLISNSEMKLLNS